MTSTDMARHIKSGDTVMVITGADKGKTGRVLRVLTDKNRWSSKGSTACGSTCGRAA